MRIKRIREYIIREYNHIQIHKMHEQQLLKIDEISHEHSDQNEIKPKKYIDHYTKLTLSYSTGFWRALVAIVRTNWSVGIG